MAVKTFGSERLLSTDINTYLANSGLVYVAETTFSGATTPFINGCFSSSFENYRIVMNFYTSATTNMRLRLRYGTSTTELGLVYDRYGFFITNGAVTNSTAFSEDSYYFISTTGGTSEITPVAMDIFGPNITRKTVAQCQAWNTSTGSNMFLTGRIATTTQYTGLQIAPDSGTVTGSLRVYGYRQA